MRILLSVVFCFSFYQEILAQTINLNEGFIHQNLRTAQLLGEFDSSVSFTSLPIHTGKIGVKIDSSLIGSKEYGATLKTFFWKAWHIKNIAS